MRHFVWTDLDASGRESALARPMEIADAALMARVRDVLSDVKARGDAALAAFTARFDTDAPVQLCVPQAELEAAWNALSASDQAVIDRARRNVKTFHAAQMPADIEVETEPGVVCRDGCE